MDWLDGQARRRWLDEKNAQLSNALRYYAGPAAEPINALAQGAAALSPGADMMDMVQSGGDLMGSGNALDAAKNVGWLGASTLGMALPGNVGMVKDALRVERRGKTLADAYVGGKFAGQIGLADGGPFVSSVTVEPEFRKQGVGAALYKEAEAMAGRPLVPSPLGLTDDATRVWKKRLAKMAPEDANRLIDESMEIGRGYGIRDEHLTPRLGPLRQQEAPKGIRAYHGSPHDFDKFSMDKIGTGEGAQAFGHGLYFAEKEGVAKSYRDALAGRQEDARQAAKNFLDKFGDHATAAERMQQTFDQAIKGMNDPGQNEKWASAIAMLQDGANLADVRPPGHMYEVNINANPEDFLDWDKPLSAQNEKVRGLTRGGKFSGWETSELEPNVIRRMGPRGAEGQVRMIDRGQGPEWLAEYDTLGGHGSQRFKTREEAQGWIDSEAPIEAGRGAEIYQTMRKSQPDPEITSALRDAGIPGIRYLDQGSRTAGQGTHNYVVFSPETISILRKYGILGALGAGGYGAMQGEQEPKA
jgi:GNAT superfamily N-acetyltransferase